VPPPWRGEKQIGIVTPSLDVVLQRDHRPITSIRMLARRQSPHHPATEIVRNGKHFLSIDRPEELQHLIVGFARS
jgi:pimeloyl-ACP methyl ester carboxylesterase